MSKLKYWNIMLACLLLWGCGSIHEEDDVVERIVVGSRVPIFSVNVVDYEGLTTSFSTNRLYGETVIVFFSTQCKDCQRELPELNEYYLKHKDDEGFQMVAISRAEGEQSVADFWSANNLQIPYSAQEDRKIYDLFASSVIPRVYFVPSSGIITKVLIENFDLE
jgi:thiol-disulfide isomerase/thioredoxin